MILLLGQAALIAAVLSICFGPLVVDGTIVTMGDVGFVAGLFATVGVVLIINAKLMERRRP